MWDPLVRPSVDQAASFEPAADGAPRRSWTIWRGLPGAHPTSRPSSAMPPAAWRVLSHRELAALVDRFAAALLELGVLAASPAHPKIRPVHARILSSPLSILALVMETVSFVVATDAAIPIRRLRVNFIGALIPDPRTSA